MDYNVLRKDIEEKCLREAVKDPKKRRVEVSQRASGSASGLPFEPWTRDILRECGYTAFLQEEFIGEIVKKLKDKGYKESKIEETIREKTWWGMKDYMISRGQLEAAFKGNEIPAYQQSIADIVLFYGKNLAEDLNDVIIINVKSHDIDRESRDPNIISAKRILELSKDVLEKAITHPEFINKLNLWFVGIYYKRRRGYGEIQEVHVKDFFKLDVTKIPVINFDAAIQIQWHVKNMIEKDDIDKLTFIENLAKEYIKRWNEFSRRRTQELEKTIENIKSLIERIKSQRRLF